MAANLVDKLPMLVGAGAGVLLVVAFIIGFVKGVRKVSWFGATWITAGAAFLLIARKITIEGTPTVKFGKTLAIALLCVAAALALYGALAYLLRPRIRWVKDNVNGDTTLAEYGLEYEPEYLDYDGEDDGKPYGKRIHKTGFNPPKIGGRLLGGLAGVLNVAVILWAAISVTLLVINSTGLAAMVIGKVLNVKIVAKVLEFAQFALLDGLAIGVIVALGHKGFESGLLNSLRNIIVSFGSIAAIGACFYLPFSPWAANETGFFSFLPVVINRCADALGGKLPFEDVFAKLIAGACFSVAAVGLMVLLNILLKKCCKLVSGAAPTRMVDKILSSVLYMVIGAAVCVGVWFILALVEHFGLFNISKVLNEYAKLTNGLFDFSKGLVDRLLGML